MKTAQYLMLLIMLISITILSARPSAASESGTETATGQTCTARYLGVEGYGTEKATREYLDEFNYCFLVDGEECVFTIDNGEADKDGNYAYPIQNLLKEGYEYELSVEGTTVKSAKEIPSQPVEYDPPVTGTSGEKTIRNFLALAMEPVGTTLYIYGGGWNWQDNAASVQTRETGVSQDWLRFFASQDEMFTYRDIDGDDAKKDPVNSFYPYGEYNEYYYAGLDCSGYVGWVIYNLENTENGKDGYVTYACDMSLMLQDMGYGKLTQEKTVRPGDVVSLGGHVWISLGTCSDGSVVVLHSTPSDSRKGQPGGGVQIGAIGTSEECEAYKLADHYMSEYFPEWYSRYPAALRDEADYFDFSDENTGVFSWVPSESGVTDPEGIQDMTPEEVLEELFG